MKSALILFCLTFYVVQALPTPQDDVGEIPPPPPAGSKPPPFLETLNDDSKKESSSDNGKDTSTVNEAAPAPTAPETQVLPVEAITENKEAEAVAVTGGGGGAVSAGNRRDVPIEEEECGAACMLANQTPIIFLVLILVLIILLLIILFGCYFMKKLHGKAIFTTGGQRNRNPSGPPAGARAGPTPTYLTSPPGDVVHHETKTYEKLIPGGKETTQVTTTKTTKMTSSSSGDLV